MVLGRMVQAVSIVAKGGAGEFTTIYRAVGPDELLDIRNINGFRASAFGSEGKYFTTDPLGAASYARQAVHAFGDPPYTLVSTRVPNSYLNLPGIQTTVDGGIPTYVIPNNYLKGLPPTIHDYFPVPPLP
jgi:hypothetical protein